MARVEQHLIFRKDEYFFIQTDKFIYKGGQTGNWSKFNSKITQCCQVITKVRCAINASTGLNVYLCLIIRQWLYIYRHHDDVILIALSINQTIFIV